MNQQILDELIGDPPRSSVDLDAIIKRQRRRRQGLHLATGGLGAAGVVLAVFLGVSLAVGGQVTVRPAATPEPSTQQSRRQMEKPPAGPTTGGFPLQVGSEAGRQETVNQLRTAWEQATATYAAGATWIYMPDVPGEARTPDGHPRMWVAKDPVTFEGRSGITAQSRKGGFYLSVRPATCEAGLSCSPVYACDGTFPQCTTSRTPGGLDVVQWSEKPPASRGKTYVFYGVQVKLRGGAWTLTLQAVNYFGGDGSPVSAPAPVLTRTQLASIAAGVAEQIRPEADGTAPTPR